MHACGLWTPVLIRCLCLQYKARTSQTMTHTFNSASPTAPSFDVEARWLSCGETGLPYLADDLFLEVAVQVLPYA